MTLRVATHASLVALLGVVAVTAACSDDPAAGTPTLAAADSGLPAPSASSTPSTPPSVDTNVGGFSGMAPQPSRPGSSPLRRLNADEYARTLRDLFPAVTLPADIDLPPDPIVLAFDNNAGAQSAAPLLVERYEAIAAEVATLATANLAAFAGCTAATPAEGASCARTFVTAFGKRAYRRPLLQDEVDRLVAFVTAASGGNDFPTSMRLLVSAMLQTPQFLYRTEVGTGAPDAAGDVALSPYEIASRLSYFFWRSMPDDALFAAAAAGKLTLTADIEAQARRMLADPKAKDVVQSFHAQWLRDGQPAASELGLQKDPTLFPTFNAALGTAMFDETRRFVDHVLWEGDGSFRSLLTSNETYVNGPLADFYGVPRPPGSSMTLTTLDPSQRAGILTRASFLASRAHANIGSPVLRGKFVLDQLLCTPPAPPPPGVDVTPPNPGQASAAKTTRQLYAAHSAGACKGCHESLDGAGFGLENFDAIGHFRTTENGEMVDASGTLALAAGNRSYNGALELSTILADSTDVKECVTRQWFRFTFGRQETTDDIGTLQAAFSGFTGTNQKVLELMVSLVKTKSFVSRRPVSP